MNHTISIQYGSWVVYAGLLRPDGPGALHHVEPVSHTACFAPLVGSRTHHRHLHGSRMLDRTIHCCACVMWRLTSSFVAVLEESVVTEIAHRYRQCECFPSTCERSRALVSTYTASADTSARVAQRLDAETCHGRTCEIMIRFEKDADHAAETARSGGNEEMVQ